MKRRLAGDGHTAGYTKLARELIASLRESVTLEESGAKELQVGAAFIRALRRGTRSSLSRGGSEAACLVGLRSARESNSTQPLSLHTQAKAECRALFLRVGRKPKAGGG